MGSSSSGVVGKHLAVLFEEGTLGGLDDRSLLDRFRSGRDTAAESAFAALVARHGPMVHGVCRRVLGDPHDADDAAQATFLALARKANSIRCRDSLAGWLFHVAHRVSVRASVRDARRRRHERQCASMGGEVDEDGPRETSWEELHEELDRLPASLRVPLVLCHLEGLTNEQAAERLRCPIRTVQRRLTQGRERLRARLTCRGFAPTAALLGTGVEALAPPPTVWAVATVRLAMLCATGGEAAIPSTVAALTDGVLRAYWLALIGYATAMLTMIVMVTGTVALSNRRPAQSDARDHRRFVRDTRSAIDRPALPGPIAADDYVLLGKPVPLHDLSQTNISSFSCHDGDFAGRMGCEVEEVEGGDLNITLLHTIPSRGLPEPDYRPVVFDSQWRRFVATRGPVASTSGPRGAEFSLDRFRLGANELSADRRAFIVVERRLTEARPSTTRTVADRATPHAQGPLTSHPRVAPADGFSWAIEPRRVGPHGWETPVASGAVLGDVVKTRDGGIHVRLAFATRETFANGHSICRAVVIDTRGRRQLLNLSSRHGGFGGPLTDGPDAATLVAWTNLIAPDRAGREFLPAFTEDYPSALDVASIGIERATRDQLPAAETGP